MKIGLRTLKTVVACLLAMLLASHLNLIYAPSAGIIAILSLGNTKKKSLSVGLARFFALILATILSFLTFGLLGFNAYGFALFILLFIPLTVKFSLTDGIVVTSVLVTHYMLEKHFSGWLILNEFLLMAIGVGMSLLLNLYMPNLEEKLKRAQDEIEEGFRQVFQEMSNSLNKKSQKDLLERTDQLSKAIQFGLNEAMVHQENHWLRSNYYYENYFLMRKSQLRLIEEMVALLEKIQTKEELVEDLRILLSNTSQTLSEENDGRQILKEISWVLESYRLKPMPSNRLEFENRARLFQFLQTYKNFIEIKTEFSNIKYHVD